MTQPRSQDRRRQVATKNRVGFSLIEVLVVIAITLLMGGALLQALHQYGWINSASRNQVNRAIIARAVLDEVRQTLRGLARDRVTDRQASESDPLDADFRETGSLEIDSLEVDDEARDSTTDVVRTTSGLIGGERSIAMLTVAGDLPGSRWVVYSTTRHNSCEIPALSGRWASGYRMTGRFDDDTLIKLLPPEMVSGRIEDLLWVGNVGEVPLLKGLTEIRFHYYDGLEWHGEWDSRIDNQLPTAVRITVTLSKATGDGDARSAAPAADVFSTIIELTQR